MAAITKKVAKKTTPAKKAAPPAATKKTAPNKTGKHGPAAEAGDGMASKHIDARIAELGDWRGEMLARVRELVHEGAPGVTEAWKWRGVPTWYLDGMICTGETYKDHVKVTFAKGAELDDPDKVFNSSLDGNVRRAVDLFEGDTLRGPAFKELVRQAVRLNRTKAKR
jgi:hypothetical protein